MECETKSETKSSESAPKRYGNQPAERNTSENFKLLNLELEMGG